MDYPYFSVFSHVLTLAYSTYLEKTNRHLFLVLTVVTSFPLASLLVVLSSELPSGRRTKLLEEKEEEENEVVGRKKSGEDGWNGEKT